MDLHSMMNFRKLTIISPFATPVNALPYQTGLFMGSTWQATASRLQQASHLVIGVQDNCWLIIGGDATQSIGDYHESYIIHVWESRLSNHVFLV
jgi:hypothetical protein